MSTDTEFAIRRKQMAVDEQSTVLTSLAQSEGVNEPRL
jgi:hypothetical protein